MTFPGPREARPAGVRRGIVQLLRLDDHQVAVAAPALVTVDRARIAELRFRDPVAWQERLGAARGVELDVRTAGVARAGAGRRRVGLLPEGRAPMRGGVALFAKEGASPVGAITPRGFRPSPGPPAIS